MRRVTHFIGVFLLCSFAASADEGRRLDGETLYLKECGICHLPGEMATNILSRRLGKERGVLAMRADLTPEFVMSVARSGQLMMPRFSRVEVSDAELRAIAGYLAEHTRQGGQ